MKRYNSILAAGLALAALAPLRSPAASQTWNGSGGATWDLITPSWVSPTTWVQGNDAIFGATGAGTVTLGSDINAGNITFNAPGYSLVAAGFYSTNSGFTAALGTSNNIQLSIYGPQSVTFNGLGTNVLLGDPSVGDANHYTGATYIHSGTVILEAMSGGNGNSSAAIGSIASLDAGALLQMGFPSTPPPGGALVDLPAGQLPYNRPGATLHMTGGTLDLNGWRRNGPGGPMPCPDGSGLIINSSPWLQSSIVVYGDGNNHTFSGQINDGGAPGPLSPAPFSDKPYQMGILDLHYGSGGYELTLSGANTYSGSTRLGNASIKLSGAGTLGIPSTIPGWTGPLRIYSGNHLDLNGTSQTVGGMGSSGTGGNCYNSAVGTVSTLRGGPYGSDSFDCGWNIIDNTGTGGIVALTCYGTGTQNYSANAPGNSYSGDTVVLNGTNSFSVATAVSPNSAFRLHTPTATGGVLKLTYPGTANVKQLFVNGAQQANGTYGAAQFPGIITGTGTITVTGSTGADFVWDNGSANGFWDLTSVNWSGSTWSQGAGAIFNTAGGGTVTLAAIPGAYNMPSLVLNSNTTINAGGSYSTNAVITSASGTSNALYLSMWGTNGLVLNGPGTTVLLGDPSVGDASHYTGGTYIRSGTVIGLAANAGTGGGSPYAIDSVEALDTGATLVLPGIPSGSPSVAFGSDRDQIGWHNTTSFPGGSNPSAFSHMHLTGGTLDFKDDPKQQRIPIVDGSGLIINSGGQEQAQVAMANDGFDHAFSGVIADGNNGVLSGDNVHGDGKGPGYQIGIVTFSDTAPNKYSNPRGFNWWTLSGANTYSGSTRIDTGAAIKLVGNGTIGQPLAALGLTGPMRIYGPGGLELNGHSQTIANMTDGSSSGWISNSAPNTVSVFSFGYGNEFSYGRACSYIFGDSPSTGAILSLKKVSTGLPYIVPNSWTSSTNEATIIYATNSWQTLKSTAVCTYSGDTVVAGGVLVLQGPSAVSPNSAYRLQSTPAPGCVSSSCLLYLQYSGTANVRQLWINGVQQPNGVYGAGTPGIHPASTGTLTVTGYAPVMLNAAHSGSNLNLSWSGVYKLQTSTSLTSGVWTDVPGGATSPVSIPVNPATPQQFYRLVTF